MQENVDNTNQSMWYFRSRVTQICTNELTITWLAQTDYLNQSKNIANLAPGTNFSETLIEIHTF